jgi:glycosyltransferase involved in cell wall biosynthesis
VGLNLAFLTPGNQGGLEVYARKLIEGLLAHDDLQLTAFVSRSAGDLSLGSRVHTVVLPITPDDRKQWVIGDQFYIPRAAGSEKCEILHNLASTSPIFGHAQRVTTIHDLNYKLAPGAHSRGLTLGMSLLVRAAARRSHRLIAVSQSTADDLVNYLRVPEAKVDVVLNGVDLEPTVTPTPEGALRAALNLGSRTVLLSLSAKRPSKNLLRLLQAHAMLSAPRPILVLPGYPTLHEEELRAAAKYLGTDRDVRFLGWISDEDREGLYALAAIFVFPSLYEGFGLPPLEAMARGVPVLTSGRGSISEVVGNGALLIDPESVEDIFNGIRRLLDDSRERERLRFLGRLRAAQFSWAKTAKETRAVYLQALGRQNTDG